MTTHCTNNENRKVLLPPPTPHSLYLCSSNDTCEDPQNAKHRIIPNERNKWFIVASSTHSIIIIIIIVIVINNIIIIAIIIIIIDIIFNSSRDTKHEALERNFLFSSHIFLFSIPYEY